MATKAKLQGVWRLERKCSCQVKARNISWNLQGGTEHWLVSSPVCEEVGDEAVISHLSWGNCDRSSFLLSTLSGLKDMLFHLEPVFIGTCYGSGLPLLYSQFSWVHLFLLLVCMFKHWNKTLFSNIFLSYVIPVSGFSCKP